MSRLPGITACAVAPPGLRPVRVRKVASGTWEVRQLPMSFRYRGSRVAAEDDRVPDRRPRILRLIERWLKAGVLESRNWQAGETGTAQGLGISPLLANAFLHYIFDLWVSSEQCEHGNFSGYSIWNDKGAVGMRVLRPMF